VLHKLLNFLNKRYSLYHNAVKQAFETANKTEDFDAKKIFSAYRSQLEAEGEK
jgi:DNA-binding ferritin-like protein